MLDYVPLSSIRATTNRLPFTEGELSATLEYLKLSAQKGRDLQPSPAMNTRGAGFSTSLEDGILILNSPSMLSTDVLFVKLNAGKGLLGGQKANYSSFVGSAEEDAWMPGTSFKSLLVALTSITNLYEGSGFR